MATYDKNGFKKLNFFDFLNGGEPWGTLDWLIDCFIKKIGVNFQVFLDVSDYILVLVLFQYIKSKNIKI